jgi:hypothetical protein
VNNDSAVGLIFKIALCTLCAIARLDACRGKKHQKAKEVEMSKAAEGSFKGASVPSPVLFHDLWLIDPVCDR